MHYKGGNCLGSLLKWKVGTLLRNLIKEVLSTEIGDKIYPLIAPENTTGDFIVYQRTGYQKADVKEGVYSDTAFVQITIVSDNYDTGVSMAEKLDEALTGVNKVTVDGVEYEVIFQMVDGSEEFQDFKYLQTIKFSIC